MTLHLAVAKLLSRGDAISAWRNAELGTKTSDEVGQVLEAYVQRNFRDRLPGGYEPARRVTKARAQQPLMGCNTGHALERAQEMVPAETATRASSASV